MKVKNSIPLSSYSLRHSAGSAKAVLRLERVSLPLCVSKLRGASVCDTLRERREAGRSPKNHTFTQQRQKIYFCQRSIGKL